MQSIASTSKKMETLIVETVQKYINSTPNPDLATSILYMLDYRSPQTRKELASKLNLQQTDIEEAVDNHLIPNELIQPSKDKESLYLYESSKTYIESGAYGPGYLFEKEELKDEIILATMNSVNDLVKFHYKKRFEFPMEKLEKISNLSHNALKDIREREKEFFYDELEVPREFAAYIPTFVSENNPHKISGYNENNFDLQADFFSPDLAFQIGFDSAVGYPRLDEMLETVYGKKDFLPGCVEIYLLGGVVFIKNIRYDAAKDSFQYQQKAKEILPIIQGRLEKALV